MGVHDVTIANDADFEVASEMIGVKVVYSPCGLYTLLGIPLRRHVKTCSPSCYSCVMAPLTSIP